MNPMVLTFRLLKNRLFHGYQRRRGYADFGVDEEHNPYVLQNCPRCKGSGRISKRCVSRGALTHTRCLCMHCLGSGTTGTIERYFENDATPATVSCDSDGWLTCPACGWRFNVKDKNVWTGQRHIKGRAICGQRINIE